MIAVESVPLTEHKASELEKWLVDPRASTFILLLEGEIKRLEAAALVELDKVKDCPDYALAAKAHLQDAERYKAARQIFLQFQQLEKFTIHTVH